jgi:AmiR/NasT family two-component response regulator
VAEAHSLRILIADDDPGPMSCLRMQLTDLGYVVVAEAKDVREAVFLARQLHPNLVLMDIKMPNVDGLEASRQIDEEGICPIVLLSAYSDRTLVDRACSLSAVQAYLVKPLAARDLEPAIELAVHRFQRFKRLQREAIQPPHSADARPVLDRAIECLVAHHGCSPQEAHGWLLREAMAEKVALDRLAWEIVAGDENRYSSGHRESQVEPTQDILALAR